MAKSVLSPLLQLCVPSSLLDSKIDSVSRTTLKRATGVKKECCCRTTVAADGGLFTRFLRKVSTEKHGLGRQIRVHRSFAFMNVSHTTAQHCSTRPGERPPRATDCNHIRQKALVVAQ
jgi:hypothetical protein